MAKTGHEEAGIDRRRQRVAELVVRHRTQREICDTLAAEGFANPETGEPYSLGTVNADIKLLRAQWRRDSARDIQTHRSELLAELAAVKRAAWGDGDLQAVLRALKQQADILGLSQTVDDRPDSLFVLKIERIASRGAPPALPAGTVSAN